MDQRQIELLCTSHSIASEVALITCTSSSSCCSRRLYQGVLGMHEASRSSLTTRRLAVMIQNVVLKSSTQHWH